MSELFHWGREGSFAPPIAAGSEAALLRQLALRACVNASAEVGFDHAVKPIFEVAAQGDAQARLMRFLGLVTRLVRTELRLLRRHLRCEGHVTRDLCRTPGRGQLDAVRTLRNPSLAMPGMPPRAWVLRRVERFADTPINKLVASILHRTRSFVGVAERTIDTRWVLRPGELSLLRRARLAIDRFLASTPTGTIPIDDDDEPERLATIAARRRAEYRNVRSLVSWWRELHRTNLTELRAASTHEPLDNLSVHECYEMTAALMLALTVRDRVGPATLVEPGRIEFLTKSGRLEVCFGAHAREGRRARPPTSVLRYADTPERCVVMEARNGEVEDIGRLVDGLCDAADSGSRAVLVTPSAIADLPSHVRSCVLDVRRSVIEPVFDDVLDSFFEKRDS